jgi:hypothetical protein
VKIKRWSQKRRPGINTESTKKEMDNDDVDGTKEVLKLIFLVGTPIVSSWGRLLSGTEYQYKRVCRLLD